MQVNVLTEEPKPVLDQALNGWLGMVSRYTGMGKTCPIPAHHFDALQTLGLVTGSANAAKLSPQGMSNVVSENAKPKVKPKPKVKRK